MVLIGTELFKPYEIRLAFLLLFFGSGCGHFGVLDLFDMGNETCPQKLISLSIFAATCTFANGTNRQVPDNGFLNFVLFSYKNICCSSYKIWY